MLLSKNGQLDMSMFKKGQVWWCKDFITSDLDKKSEWAEGIYVGDRPVILSTDTIIQGKIQAIPMSSMKKRISNISTMPGIHIILEPNIISKVMIHMQKPIAVSSLTRFLGQISDDILEHIDRALSIYYGIADKSIVEEYYGKYFTPDVLNTGITDSEFIFTKREIPDMSKQTDAIKSSKSSAGKSTNKAKSSSRKTPRKKRAESIDLTQWSQIELQRFLSDSASSICSKYNISRSTVYRYREQINREHLIKCKISYTDKVYQTFIGKQLNILSLEDKQLFIKLDPQKLSEVLILPIDEINTYVKRFKVELNIA